MAPPLTWRNVDAPDFRGSLAGLQVFNDSIKSAFGGLNQGIEAFKADRTENADRLGLAAALKFQDPTAYKAALMSGGLPGMDSGLMSTRALDLLGNRVGNLLGNATTEQALNTSKALDPYRISGAEQDVIKKTRDNRLGDATFDALARKPFLDNQATIAGIGLTGAQTRNTDASADATNENTWFQRNTRDVRAGQLGDTRDATQANTARTRQGIEQGDITFARGTQAYEDGVKGAEIADAVMRSGGNPDEYRQIIETDYANATPGQRAAALARLEPRTGSLYGFRGGAANAPTDNLTAGALRDRILADPTLTPEQREAQLRDISFGRSEALTGNRRGTQYAANAGVGGVYNGVAPPVPVPTNLADQAIRGATETGNNLAVAQSDSMSRGVTATDLLAALPSNADESQVIDALTAEGAGNLSGADRSVLQSKLQEVMRITGKSAAVAGQIMRRSTTTEDGPLAQLNRSIFSLGGLTPSQFDTANLGNGRRFDDAKLAEYARRVARGETLDNVLNLGTSNQALAQSLSTAQNTYAAASTQLAQLERDVTQGGMRGRTRFLEEARARKKAAEDALKAIREAVEKADPRNQRTQTPDSNTRQPQRLPVN